jgi:hypothetical protein
VSAIRKLIETAREQSTYFPRHSYSRDVLATEADAAEAELKELEAQLGEQGEDITDMKAVIGNQQEQLGVHARQDEAAELLRGSGWTVTPPPVRQTPSADAHESKMREMPIVRVLPTGGVVL